MGSGAMTQPPPPPPGFVLQPPLATVPPPPEGFVLQGPEAEPQGLAKAAGATSEPESWLDALMSGLSYADATGANVVRGLRTGVSNTAGLPVDAMNALPLLGNILPGEQGFRRMSDMGLPEGQHQAPFLGSEFIDNALGGFGAIEEPPAPQDMVQRFGRRIGEEVGAAAVPAAGILTAAGRMGVQGARNGGVLSRMFIEPAAVNPSRFVGQETAAATAAGAGAAGANEMAPDSPMADLLGAIFGAGVYGAGRKIGGMAGETLHALTGKASYVDDVVREAVTDRIAKEAGLRPAQPGGAIDTTDLVEAIGRGPRVGNTIPGYQESLADRTGNPGIASLEYSRQSGPNSGVFTSRRSSNTAAVDSAMSRSEPNGTPGAFRSALEDERQNLVGAAGTEATHARDAADTMAYNLAPTMDAEARGANIRAALQDASEQAYELVRQLFAPINESDAVVDMAPLAERFGQIDSRLSTAERRRFQSPEASIPAELAESGEQPIREVTGLRSALTDVAREAAASGDRQGARVANQNVSALDEFLEEALGGGRQQPLPEPHATYQAQIEALDAAGAPDSAYRNILSTGSKGDLRRGETWRGRVESYINRARQEQAVGPSPTPPAANAPDAEWEAYRAARAGWTERMNSPAPPASNGLFEQYQAAREARRGYADRFERPGDAISETLRTREGGGPRRPDSAVTRPFVQPNEGRRRDFDMLHQEAGQDDRVRGAVSDQVKADVQPRLTAADRLDAYMAANSQTLDQYPDLRAELEEMAGRRRTADRATQEEKNILREFGPGGSSSVAKYLQYGDEKAENAMKGVLAAKQPGQAIDDLLTFVNDDPAAVEGARRVFWNILQKRGRSAGETTLTMDGSQPWMPQRLRRFLEDPSTQAVAERLWRDNPEHLQNIREIAETLQGVDLRSRAKAPNTSGTTQGMNELLTPEALQSRIYAVQSGRISMVYFLTSLASVTGRRAVRAARGQAIERVLDEALNNPEAAAMLLRENNPANRAALARRAKTWMGNEASTLIDMLSDEIIEPPEDGGPLRVTLDPNAHDDDRDELMRAIEGR